MGLFDRFKKNNNKDNSVDELVKKADKLTEVMAQQEKAMDDTENIAKIRIARAKKEEHYKALMSRIITLLQLHMKKIIIIEKNGADKAAEWLREYKEKMTDYDYRYGDINLPDFPLTGDDIYYPKRDYALLKTLEQLLNTNDEYRTGQEILGGMEDVFRPIDSQEPLYTVRGGRVITDAIIDAYMPNDDLGLKGRSR